MLIPAGRSAGLTTVSLGMLRALHQQGVSVNFFKPVAQPRIKTEEEPSTAIVRNIAKLKPATPINMSCVEEMISHDNIDVLLEEIIANYENNYNNEDVTIIEGLVAATHQPFTVRLNKAICNALDAKIVLVYNPSDESPEQINDKLEIASENYGGHKSDKIIGCIFNKINAPLDENGRIRLDLNQTPRAIEAPERIDTLKKLPLFKSSCFMLGAVTWDFDLVAPRVIDLVEHLRAKVICRGNLEYRRLRSIHFCGREINNLTHAFKPGALLVVSADRSDVIVSACLAALNGTKIGALLLTGGDEPNDKIMQLCYQAFGTGLPVISVNDNTWQTAMQLQYFNKEVPIDDEYRINRVMDHTAHCIDETWIHSLTHGPNVDRKISPAAFRYKLSRLAKQAAKTIVLPEGEEARTIEAASVCAQRGIAKCVLLGNKEVIEQQANQQGLIFNENITILDPECIRKDYVDPMVKLRKHKGLTKVVANHQLQDNVVLGTMMLERGDVDGLVSGAVNTTANTIRPALQLIKTDENSSLVSSVFFMLLPEQVLVYGDCAINPDPTAGQLADIAIQSADSAKAFGIDPKVAMISYSTGTSGTGSDVEKVKKATALAQSKRPDLLIDGPLQYDAAVMKSVASKKAPDSPVAGQATVLVFPDLNTGNTTYKAVQRSADVVSIGPMLQGLKKPVNDLSRGALVDDIIFTIALTAIQATS